MEYSIMPANQLSDRMVGDWARIICENPSFDNPLFAPEYTLAVSSVIPNIHVTVQQDSDTCLAFLPFMMTKFGIAKKLFLADYDGLIHSKELDLNIPRFLKQCGLRAWDFKFLRAPYISIPHGKVQEYSVINLEEGFDAYVEARQRAGSKQIKESRASERKLIREMGSIRFEPSVISDKLLSKLLDWKTSKYGRSHRSRDQVAATLSRLMESRSTGCQGVLSALYAGDAVVALHFGLRSQTTWQYWFPAFNPEFEDYSPGIMLLLKMLECAPKLGIKSFDLGVGAEYNYKLRLRTGFGFVTSGSIVASPVLKAVRYARRGVKKLLRT
jgi:CelD/BcsL family acetyltransferase involved in cellulose biosynthesis